MSQVFGDPKRLVNDYMAGSHAIGIRRTSLLKIAQVFSNSCSLTIGVVWLTLFSYFRLIRIHHLSVRIITNLLKNRGEL